MSDKPMLTPDEMIVTLGASYMLLGMTAEEATREAIKYVGERYRPSFDARMREAHSEVSKEHPLK